MVMSVLSFVSCCFVIPILIERVTKKTESPQGLCKHNFKINLGLKFGFNLCDVIYERPLFLSVFFVSV